MPTQTTPTELALVSNHDAVAFLLEPTRRRIVAELAEPASAAALARRLGLPRQRLGHHLRELELAGFVECVEERKVRNCIERRLRVTAKCFVLQPEPLGGNSVVREAASQGSAAYLVAVAGRAIREVGELANRSRAEGRPFATLAVHTEINFRNAEERAAFAAELTACLTTLAGKYHAPDATSGRTFRCATLVHPSPAGPPAVAPVTPTDPESRPGSHPEPESDPQGEAS